MDPFSISVGALQIAGVCSQVTISIIKWVGDIRTIDARIRGFYDEIIALSATYEGLEESLRSPLMIEAARVANQTSDGAHLWAQVRIALDDSTKTVNRIKSVLDDISRHTGPLRSVKKQLTESLSNGELGRLRQRIQFFNATISLPIQMVCVMLQLEQRGMSADHQKQLDSKFMSLERMMQNLIRELTQPSSARTSTMMSGSTLYVGAADSSVDVQGKDSYLSFAKKILSTASAAASTRSSMSTITPQPDHPAAPPSELGAESVTCPPKPQSERTAQWISAPTQNNAEMFSDTQSVAGLAQVVPPESPLPRGKSYEVAYKLAHTHLKLGQEKADQENHESAERSFRKALELLAKHDLTGRIAFQPAEVVLMLSHSCLQQQKYTEAIELLIPVAAREANVFPGGAEARSPGTPTTPSPANQPDSLQALAASHMLGEVYRQKGDFELAKEHALKAFLNRTDELGEHDEKTLESVKLVIDVYRDMGDVEEAEAYEVFLTPGPRVQRAPIPSHPSRPPPATEDETAVASMSPPPSEVNVVSPSQTNISKQHRSSLTSRFREMRKPSKPALAQKRSSTDARHRHTMARASTIDDTFYTSVFLPASRVETRNTSGSPSEGSHGRTNSYVDDMSTAPSSARLERSPSTKTLEPTFQAIQQLCMEGRFSKAVKLALSFLEGYDSNVFNLRKDAIEKNIKEGGHKGLAATGHGYSPMHFFCELKEECTDEVSLLIRYGVDVNCLAYKAGYKASNSPEILTPLHLAIRRGHTAVAKLLLDSKDIHPTLPNGEGFAPLLAACRKRNYAVVQMLLNQHAPRCIPRDFPSSWHGNSVLHDAARHCDLRLIEILVQTGHFDVNRQDKFGKTPLMHAVVKSDVSNPAERARMLEGRLDVVKKLLEVGADGNLVDNIGMTARAYAEREKTGEGSAELVAELGVVRFEMP